MNDKPIIISVLGKTDSGKTASIKYALVNLLESKNLQVISNSKNYPCDTKLLIDCLKKDLDKAGNKVGDITCMCLLMGKKVCITTNGDSINGLESVFNNALNSFQEYGDLYMVVCATHETGKVTI